MLFGDNGLTIFGTIEDLPPASVTPEHHHSLGSKDLDAGRVLHPVGEHICIPHGGIGLENVSTDERELETHQQIVVVVECNLGIGGFGDDRFWVARVTSAGGVDGFRNIDTQDPTGEVDLVTGVVCNIAATIAPQVVPITFHSGVISMLGCRAIPDVPVQMFWGITIFCWRHDAPFRFLIIDSAQVHRTQFPVLDIFLGRHIVGGTSVLEPALNYPVVVLPRRLDHLLSFPAVVCGRFFNVNIFPVRAGEYRGQGVPVVGSCRDDRGHSGIIKCFSKILHNRRGLTLFLSDRRRLLLRSFGIRITRIGVFTIISVQKTLNQATTASAAPDSCQHDFVARRCRSDRFRIAENRNTGRRS